ncbi:G-patch domain-containing protein [Apiospora saccharicola]|uniref:G-patch domain-containing protein n=1 Tax=Apiospora saccharicola TaxID=335842 RepID=A0ABR1WI22_9PEZI
MADADEPDDYMSMDFSSIPTKPAVETSLQRKQRLRREAEIKGRPKSKAELAADEAAARDHALSKSLLDPTAPTAQKSKGLAMMKKMGFVAGSTLGAQDGAASANAEPIRISIKEDRSGIGLDAERKRKVDEAADQQGLPPQGKRFKVVDEGEFRDRVRKEREAARTERQVYAAQKVAEMLDEEVRGQGQTQKSKSRALSTRPLKSIHVFWRGLVRQREEAERVRRMRHDLEQSLLSRLPTYEEEDDEDDAETQQAMGKPDQVVAPFEDLEEEDAELDEFNGLEPDVRLQRLVVYLRDDYRYCFWCKCAYPDKEMDGCPGLTEEDHD